MIGLKTGVILDFSRCEVFPVIDTVGLSWEMLPWGE